MTVSNYGPWFDATIGPFIPGAKILLVGTGYEKIQYESKPRDFKGKGAAAVVYLEVWMPYCIRWSEGVTPIIYGDIRNYKQLFAEKAWDIVLLDQGIEHFHRSEHENILEGMFYLSRRVAVATCPFGSRYDGQGECNGNPYETHQAKNLSAADFAHLEDWNVQEFGDRDAGDAQVAVWRVR